MREFRVVLRPAKKHKFKFDYLPISYEIVDHVLERTIVFNGQSYTVGLPVNVDAKFTTLKIGYEYDFLYNDRGYLGFVLDTKITRARIDFDSPINSEFAEAVAPIPTVGLAGRGYVARNVAVGGEFTFFQIPGGEDRDYDGSYFDYDVYGTVNFTNNVGVTGGWRKLDLDYTWSATSARSTWRASTSWASCASSPLAAGPTRSRSRRRAGGSRDCGDRRRRDGRRARLRSRSGWRGRQAAPRRAPPRLAPDRASAASLRR